MAHQITEELNNALNSHHGIVEAESSDGKVVLMAMKVYREIMGVADDESFQESVQAIEEGLAQVESGKTTSMNTVFRKLDEKYGLHS